MLRVKRDWFTKQFDSQMFFVWGSREGEKLHFFCIKSPTLSTNLCFSYIFEGEGDIWTFVPPLKKIRVFYLTVDVNLCCLFLYFVMFLSLLIAWGRLFVETMLINQRKTPKLSLIVFSYYFIIGVGDIERCSTNKITFC